MYKEDLVLNNIQWLICHKKQKKLNQKQYNHYIIVTYCFIV